MLASIMFALFDLTASLLVLLGFLIFRWAVIAAPILGTVALLRPASAGFRRLANAVVAALFNIVIFGTGAAIYLYAVDLDHEHRHAAGLAAGRAGLALRRRRLAAAAAVSPDHSARRQGLGRGDRRRPEPGIGDSSGTSGKPRAGGGQAGRRCRQRSSPTDRRARVELRAEPPLQVTAQEPPPPHRSTAAASPRRMPAPAGGWLDRTRTGHRAGYALYQPRRSSVTAISPSRAPGRPGPRPERSRSMRGLLRQSRRPGRRLGRSDHLLVAAILAVARLGGGGKQPLASADRGPEPTPTVAPTAGDDARGRPDAKCLRRQRRRAVRRCQRSRARGCSADQCQRPSGIGGPVPLLHEVAL